jgi:LPXTG-motif cell wall-anchored protein
VRRLAAAAAAGAVLVLGAGTAGAQDQHSGGVSPNEESTDPGSPQADVGGTTVSRDGGLPVTGGDAAGLAAIGVAAVAVGSGAVVVSKRRARLSA